MIAIFPQIAACATQRDVEKLAALVRTQFAFTSPALDIGALMQAMGIEYESLDLDCCGTLLVRDEKGQFSVVALIPSGVPGQVARFRLAHLLGHFLLDIQGKIAEGNYSGHGYREIQCPYARYVTGVAGDLSNGMSPDESAVEDLADDFAAAVLLPESIVQAAVAKGADLPELARFFGCSPQLMNRRLTRMGLVKSAGARSHRNAYADKAGGKGPGNGMNRIREIASQLEKASANQAKR